MANVATARAFFGLGNDLSDKELLQLTASENRRKLKDFLAALAPQIPEPKVTSYWIAIRHGDNFAKRLKTLACDWGNEWITEKNTPVRVNKAKGTEKKEVFVIHFDRRIETSEEVVEAMAALGYKPADHEDLLAFGTDHPDAQREYPIVQLGSSWGRPGGGRVVSCLDGGGSGRGLGLNIWRGGWDSDCGFLAVRA